MLDASALRITEFMASNDNTLEDFEGDSSDWLEVHNPTASTVDLDGLYLTDDGGELSKWEFPAGTSIASGDFLVVFASGKDAEAPNGELHTNFKLSAGGEYLGLVADDGFTVIDEYASEYPPQEEDVSYGLSMSSVSEALVAEGDAAKAWEPSSGIFDATWTDTVFNDDFFDISGPLGFGYEDSPGDDPNFIGEFSTSVAVGTSALYVRAPFTVDSLAGVGQLTLRMKYDDGFVAYLNGVEIESQNAPVSPDSNSTASSTHDDFEAIEFQEFDVSHSLSLLVEGDNVLAIHALNFSAGSSDFLVVPELLVSRSTIVSPEDTGYFDTPTPGSGNGESFAGFAAEPTFGTPHGFYQSSQLVTIASETAGALIVYTTDGSTPAVNENLVPVNGQAYSGPVAVSSTTTIRAITFKQDFRPSFVQSSSYLFLDDVVDQSPSNAVAAGWPSSNVNGQLLDYGIDPEIIALHGEQAVKDSLLAIPSITLTTDLENLIDAETGIYVNALNRGRDWERAASVEYILPGETEGFSTNAGLRIRGGYHRNDFNPKHAFRLYFRSEYGDGLLDYPLFGEEGADRFDVLDLRTAQNYSWAAWGDTINGDQNSYLREVFARDTQADMEHPYTRSRYAHLYLNGQYWGIYMTQERIQEHYGENNLGGDEEDYDVVKSDPFESGGTEVADGDDVAWRQLFELAQSLADDPNGAANNYWSMQGLNPDGTRNESLPVLLDAENLIDYMMIIFYTGGHDTGISAFFGDERANNWFGIRNRETGDQGFQFFLHDNEHSLGAGEINGTLHGTFDIDRTGPFSGEFYDDFEYFNPAFLHQDLLAQPEYKQLFVDRAQALMFNGGVLTADANIARMLERKSQVEPAIIAESARWGDAKRVSPFTIADWDTEVDWLVDTYFPLRGDIVVGQLRNDGLLSESGAPQFSQFGGEAPAGFPLEMTAGEGTIYFTLDGVTDPRLIGGNVNPSLEVEAYTGPIVLTEDTAVWARLLDTSGQWSGIVKTTFTVPELAGDYDRNGVVNGDDYDLWEETFGSTTDLRADGNKDSFVNAADYTVWRDSLALQPTVVSPASASPTVVTGISTDLSVLGGLKAGEENLVYTWSVTGSGDVVFSSNGDNGSSDTTATFEQAGDYTFTVTIENALDGYITSSSVLVTVGQAVTGVAVLPSDVFVAAGADVQLSAFETDQFGDPVDTPSSFVWSIATGGGSVGATGLFTAPLTAGTVTVLADSPSGDATAVLNVVVPAAWYPADQISGATLVDSSGGNTGAIVGPAAWVSGVDGNALSLTGGHVELPAGIVNGVSDFTIATWFYLDSVSTWSRVFDFGNGPSSNMFLTPEAGSFNGPLRFAITNGGGQGEQQINGPDLAPGQWYHVAITLAGDTGTMYVDGVPVGTNANMTIRPSDMGVTTQNYLGDSQYSADPPLLGKIDDFRIYSEALPIEQIQHLAGSAAVALSVTEDGQVAAPLSNIALAVAATLDVDGGTQTTIAEAGSTTDSTTTSLGGVEVAAAFSIGHGTIESGYVAIALALRTGVASSTVSEIRQASFALLADSPGVESGFLHVGNADELDLPDSSTLRQGLEEHAHGVQEESLDAVFEQADSGFIRAGLSIDREI